jgi:hypothetical protein
MRRENIVMLIPWVIILNILIKNYPLKIYPLKFTHFKILSR